MNTLIRITGYLRTLVAYLIYVPGAWLVVFGVYLQADAEKAEEAYTLLLK